MKIEQDNSKLLNETLTDIKKSNDLLQKEKESNMSTIEKFKESLHKVKRYLKLKLYKL